MRNRPVARALGLADVSTPKARAAVCAQCHARRTRGTPFDPTAPVHPVKSPMSSSHPRRSTFVISAAKPSDFPPPTLPELAVVGRSTSASRASSTRSSVRTARAHVANAGPHAPHQLVRGRRATFFLVDLPGYGYAEVDRGDARELAAADRDATSRTARRSPACCSSSTSGAAPGRGARLRAVARREADADRGRADQGRQARKNKRMLEVARARKALGAAAAIRSRCRRSTSDGIEPLWRAVVELDPEVSQAVMIAPATAADLDAIDEIERHSFTRRGRARRSKPSSRVSGRASTSRARPHVIVGFCNYWIVARPDRSEVQILAIATHPIAGAPGSALASSRTRSTRAARWAACSRRSRCGAATSRRSRCTSAPGSAPCTSARATTRTTARTRS